VYFVQFRTTVTKLCLCAFSCAASQTTTFGADAHTADWEGTAFTYSHTRTEPPQTAHAPDTETNTS
jgi:hypothetical protein